MKLLSNVRPSCGRVLSTLALLLGKKSDYERWSMAGSLDSEWSNRARAIADHIPDSVSVLDIGAGQMHLRDCLPAKVRYQPADIVKRADDCLVVDLNKGEFPAGTFNFITFLGVLEYVHDIQAVAHRSAEVAPEVVFSYCVGRSFAWPYRLSMWWVNNCSTGELRDIFDRAGYEIKSMKTFKSKLMHQEVIFHAVLKEGKE